jgi:hypothetical protein
MNSASELAIQYVSSQLWGTSTSKALVHTLCFCGAEQIYTYSLVFGPNYKITPPPPPHLPPIIYTERRKAKRGDWDTAIMVVRQNDSIKVLPSFPIFVPWHPPPQDRQTGKRKKTMFPTLRVAWPVPYYVLWLIHQSICSKHLSVQCMQHPSLRGDVFNIKSQRKSIYDYYWKFSRKCCVYAPSFIPESRDSRYYLPRGVGITMDYCGQAEMYMRRVVDEL